MDPSWPWPIITDGINNNNVFSFFHNSDNTAHSVGQHPQYLYQDQQPYLYPPTLSTAQTYPYFTQGDPSGPYSNPYPNQPYHHQQVHAVQHQVQQAPPQDVSSNNAWHPPCPPAPLPARQSTSIPSLATVLLQDAFDRSLRKLNWANERMTNLANSASIASPAQIGGTCEVLESAVINMAAVQTMMGLTWTAVDSRLRNDEVRTDGQAREQGPAVYEGQTGTTTALAVLASTANTFTVNPIAFIGHALDQAPAPEPASSPLSGPAPSFPPRTEPANLTPSTIGDNPSSSASPPLNTSNSNTPRKRRRLADIGRITPVYPKGQGREVGDVAEGMEAPTPSRKELFQDDDDPTFDSDLLKEPAAVFSAPPSGDEAKGGGRGKNLGMGYWSSKRLSDVALLEKHAEGASNGETRAGDDTRDRTEVGGNLPSGDTDNSPLTSRSASPSFPAATTSASSRNSPKRGRSSDTPDLVEDVFGRPSFAASPVSARSANGRSSPSSTHTTPRVRPSNLRPATSILRPQTSFPNLPSHTFGSSTKSYSQQGGKAHNDTSRSNGAGSTASSAKKRMRYGPAAPRTSEKPWLRMSTLGKPRSAAVWPRKQENTVRGTVIALTCEMCGGSAHCACAGHRTNDDYPDEWTCPDCTYCLKHNISITAWAGGSTCIRKDCIVRAKQKRKVEAGDDNVWSMEKIIGKRRSSTWSEESRTYEYLILWNGVNPETRKRWSIADATWEPPEHVDNLASAEAAFLQSCLAHRLDARGKVKKPILLPEATEGGVWSEEGKLMVDGYSRRVMEFLGLEE